jgi:hypothetical protein
MKEYLMSKDYDGELLNDINEDIMDSLNKLSDDKIDEYGIIKGNIRVQVIWCSKDDCDCSGFDHDTSCPHWVMSY